MTSATARDEPSEVARELAKLIGALSAEAALQLEGLLANSIGSPSSAEIREARLGLLIELVSVGTGEVPGVDQYNGERDQRSARGEHWPSASALSKAYFGWQQAVRAAMRLHFIGTRARVASSHTHAPASGEYTRPEVTNAIRRFRDRHGTWPSYSEYGQWGADARRLARRGGHPDPRIPEHVVIRKLFGEWDRALAVAEREHAR